MLRVVTLAGLVLVVGACGESGDGMGDGTGGSGGTAGAGGTAGSGGDGGMGGMGSRCDDVNDVDAYAPSLSKTGFNGYVVELVQSDPEPFVGDQSWSVHVVDPNGDPLIGATIETDPQMPSMGHGTDVVAVTTDDGNGDYTLDPVNFSMPGVWEVEVILSDGTSQLDWVRFSFCVDL